MKIGFSFDRTSKEVFRGEVDPATAKFSMPRPLLRRIVTNALVFVPVLFIAFHFEQYFMFWFAIAWAAGITVWQVFAYGYFGEKFMSPEMDVTRVYTKGTLIFAACFWSILIIAVAVALYIKFPDS
jgi:hypothetical protein